MSKDHPISEHERDSYLESPTSRPSSSASISPYPYKLPPIRSSRQSSNASPIPSTLNTSESTDLRPPNTQLRASITPHPPDTPKTSQSISMTSLYARPKSAFASNNGPTYADIQRLIRSPQDSFIVIDNHDTQDDIKTISTLEMLSTSYSSRPSATRKERQGISRLDGSDGRVGKSDLVTSMASRLAKSEASLRGFRAEIQRKVFMELYVYLILISYPVFTY
jgi:hypothetical protein